MANILIVEDEHAIAEALIFNLKRKEHNVAHADDGAKALLLTRSMSFDLILLDVRLPEIDGIEVCKRLRNSEVFTPIIMLTARDSKSDIITGLNAGADDYITKPFDLDELFARIDVLLRRSLRWQDTSRPGARTDRVEFGNFWIDFKTWEAKTLRGTEVLTRKEIETMKLFVEKCGEVVSREELLDRVWELPHHPNTRIVDNVIVALRKYFEHDSQNPKHIINMRGMGYRFVK